MQIGFDIGGTNIKVGAVTDTAEIIARRRVPFPTGDDHESITSLLGGLVLELAAELNRPVSEFRSIGIAIPGTIDEKGERVIHAHNLHFHDVPLKQTMSRIFPDTPIYLANDANAAALAEHYAGAFRGYKNALFISLGTGVGGGLILDGKLYNGGLNHGVELGHMTLVQDGLICSCGNKGCIEAYCAATWIVQQGRKSIIEYPLSLIHKRAKGRLDRVSAKLVLDAAKDGDTIAKNIADRYVDYLSSAISSFTVLLDPQIIAIGGGISLTGEFLFAPLRKAAAEKSFFRAPINIVPAELGNDAGILGAAMMGFADENPSN